MPRDEASRFLPYLLTDKLELIELIVVVFQVIEAFFTMPYSRIWQPMKQWLESCECEGMFIELGDLLEPH